ncbi:FIVAR domain-containing protein [Blautia sp. RD014234]|nr:FIVAR domain-containing protein [Blautia parvula]
MKGKDPEDPEQEADKAALAKLVEKANGFTRADYTEDTWAVFDLALVNAQKVLADKAADQETVDKAGKELQAAMNQLVKVNNESSLDLSRIKAPIQKAEKLEKEDYTAASFQTFSQALKEAKAILDADGASQSDVDKKRRHLKKP